MVCVSLCVCVCVCVCVAFVHANRFDGFRVEALIFP